MVVGVVAVICVALVVLYKIAVDSGRPIRIWGKRKDLEIELQSDAPAELPGEIERKDDEKEPA